MNRFFRFLRWGPYDDWAGWLRGLAISLAAAVFMSVVEAFGSGKAPFPTRLGYWLFLILTGWLWGAFVSRLVFRTSLVSLGTWWRAAIATLALSIPFTAVVAFATMLVLGAHFELVDIPSLILSVITVSGVMVALNVLVDRQSVTTAASATPAKFLERLPLKLRGAEVWAVEAEDHYLRLHTSKGQDLILMRLADAVSELEGIEGAQVHRSWWVARDAIADAKRGDGRATLTLKDGAEAPVSRTYARLLRERGWI
jgi:DNA-binding LytR/AlgR family response regulator